jgi:hypothetical protein
MFIRGGETHWGVSAAPCGWKRTLLRKNYSNGFLVSPITITSRLARERPVSRSREVAAGEYRLLEWLLRRLEFLGARNWFFEFAFDGDIADVFILKDAVGVDGEGVGNLFYAE